MPNAAAITISTCQSTARSAADALVQRVRIIAPAATSEAFSMLIKPSATAATIAPRIVSETQARS